MSVTNNFHILIVDDEELLRITIKKILKEENYNVDTAEKGQVAIKKFLENEISLEQVMSSLKDKELSLKIETLTDILTWAKAHDIKVIAGGLESEILKQVLEKGLKGLSKEELLKLPETDLFDPAYKNYLFQKYQQLKNPNFSFENFYQAQIFKKEALAESIFKLLNQFKDALLLVFSNNKVKLKRKKIK